jgi:hypothetical protein
MNKQLEEYKASLSTTNENQRLQNECKLIDFEKRTSAKRAFYHSLYKLIIDIELEYTVFLRMYFAPENMKNYEELQSITENLLWNNLNKQLKTFQYESKVYGSDHLTGNLTTYRNSMMQLCLDPRSYEHDIAARKALHNIQSILREEII